MYLGHFGLSRQPFSQSTISDRDFFYEGGGRGAILDALIYVLTHGEGEEGMVAVTGESGSGKTVLCQMLTKRLPDSMQVVYLAKKAPSKEDLLHFIADELRFQSEKEGFVVPLVPAGADELQEVLSILHTGDRPVVLLIDEAHTLSAETLEALRLLYEQASSHHKLLQIVLAGQPELERTLASHQLRKIRKAFPHCYVLRPLDRDAASEYLLHRMSAAGYEGPDVFSSAALQLIDSAARGVPRQLNMLADKSLTAAFLASASRVEALHAKTVIMELGPKPHLDWRDKRLRPDFVGHLIAGAGVASSAVVVIVLGVVGWQATRPQPVDIDSSSASLPFEAAASSTLSTLPATTHPMAIATAPSSAPASVSAATPVLPSAGSSKESGGKIPPASTATDKTATDKANKETAAKTSADKALPGSEKAAATGVAARNGLPAETRQTGDVTDAFAGVSLAEHKLLKQRVDATRVTFSRANPSFYTIVLYTTSNIEPDRMERFLVRARNLVDLSNIYVYPVSKGKARFVVTYGLYAGEDEASMAVAELPEKYQTAFDPELRTLDELK